MKEGGEKSNHYSVGSQMKKEGLTFMASMQENWKYIKAGIIGFVKTAKAKNEQEASEAELEAAKKQVQAADEAEEKKKQLKKNSE